MKLLLMEHKNAELALKSSLLYPWPNKHLAHDMAPVEHGTLAEEWSKLMFCPLRAGGVQSRDGVSAEFSFLTSRSQRWSRGSSDSCLEPTIRCGSYLTGLKSCRSSNLWPWNAGGSNLWSLRGRAKPYIVFVWSSSYRVWCCFGVNYQFNCLTKHVQQRGSFRGVFRRLGSKCITPNKLESRVLEGDEDGGKLCVYGGQTPGRSGG